MFIHCHAVISPIRSIGNFPGIAESNTGENILYAQEPSYDHIPRVTLRRMGKAVRLTAGTALPLLKTLEHCDGIIVGTANGGMEDSIKFMNQIVQYQEGMLTPGNFVQSTPNGLASQLALFTKNNFYNCTHVHRGLSFENALLDAMLLLEEDPGKKLLVAATDEISTYNYNIERLAGWFTEEKNKGENMYSSTSTGTVAGEGSAAFIVSGENKNASVRLRSLKFGALTEGESLKQKLAEFMENEKISDLQAMISGENGDVRFRRAYLDAETILSESTSILRFKHLCGEFPTATGIGAALACRILTSGKIPETMVKKKGANKGPIQNILLFNLYQGKQYGMMLFESGR